MTSTVLLIVLFVGSLGMAVHAAMFHLQTRRWIVLRTIWCTVALTTGVLLAFGAEGLLNAFPTGTPTLAMLPVVGYILGVVLVRIGWRLPRRGRRMPEGVGRIAPEPRDMAGAHTILTSVVGAKELNKLPSRGQRGSDAKGFYWSFRGPRGKWKVYDDGSVIRPDGVHANRG